MRLTLILVFLVFSFCAKAQDATFGDVLEASADQWLVEHFLEKAGADEIKLTCPPELLEEIPQPSEVDEALHPFGRNRATEAICIDHYFKHDCDLLYAIRLLSDLYFPLFERHLNENKLPEDYKFLPIILSGLNSAYDDGENKAGLWAIDLPRARALGMRIDEWVDERKSPDLATQAACRLLKDYHKRYDGDPLRTMVAFLRGIPYADRFQPEHAGDADLIYRMTLMHVSIRLFKHTDANHHLITWLRILNKYDAIPVSEPLYYEALEEQLDLHPALLRGLNPAYHGEKIPAKYRNVPFLIPADQVPVYLSQEDSLYCYKPDEQTMAALNDARKRREPEGEATSYTVRSGDVLGLIAERFGVRVSDLRDWNNLRGDRIYAGQELLVYGAKAAKGQTADSEVKKKPTRDKRDKTPLPPAKGDYQTYTVQSGESLWLIARKFPGVSADNIMQWNGITEDIRPGQQLKIYTP